MVESITLCFMHSAIVGRLLNAWNTRLQTIYIYIYIYIWMQHPTKRQLYGHLPPISKTMQIRRTRYAGHCRRSKNELINDVLLWTPLHWCTSVGRLRKTNLQQLCTDTVCSLENQSGAMGEWNEWRERGRERERERESLGNLRYQHDLMMIHTHTHTYIYIYIYIYIMTICYKPNRNIS